jgi:hypothetical protein
VNPKTLADRSTQRDADRFVGRRAELAFFDELLVEDPPASVVMVHGPGGIGKSALLREVARRGAARGFSAWLTDARELAPVPGELETILAGARAEERPLILFDTYEKMSALGTLLRGEILPALPEQALVVLAGREPPASEWFQGGWEHLVQSLELGPLDREDSAALVDSYEIVDETAIPGLLRWAQGSPLALTLAAAVAHEQGTWSESEAAQSPDFIGTLVRRLALTDLDVNHADVTAVAAIARVTTAVMLADVLPSIDPNAAQAWLRAQAITEPVADGVSMHDLVRQAVRAHLRANRTERERELRRRIADHLFARAAAGEPRLMVDLADLIESQALRWAFGAEAAPGLRLDSARPADLDETVAAGRGGSGSEWFEHTKTLLEASAEHFVVARDEGDKARGLAITFTPRNASDAALADPYVGAWIRHAREHAPDGNALLWRDVLDLSASVAGDPDSRIVATVNTAAILRSGLVNPRLFYIPINPVNLPSVAFAEQSGSRHVPELDVQVGDKLHQCHVIDHGPDGMLGAERDVVYAEIGVAAPRSGGSAPSLSPPSLTVDDVRQGLRDLNRPSHLATNPLAARSEGGDPATAVRRVLTTAATNAFGSGLEEGLLRQVVHRAYVDHHTTHEQAAVDLHLSRATYFRRLRQATDRVCDYVLAQARAANPGPPAI